MKIESVDLFYLRMPEVLDIGDGSQDALLVRVRAGNYEGWGETEASPLTSIASWIAPMSHSACHPIIDSVLGEELNSKSDIERIAKKVRSNSFYGIIQSDLTFSGIEIAMWDLLGKFYQEPIYKLLGYESNIPKRPYASVLFGDSPSETFDKATKIVAQGFSAVKFGWGPYGKISAKFDEELVTAAREGLGKSTDLMIDAGTIFDQDLDLAAQRAPSLINANVTWFEEPFTSSASSTYHELSKKFPTLKLAGGEAAHSYLEAKNLIDNAGLKFIQIDTGYVGGISNGYAIAQYAKARQITYVNHTFTSHCALSASLQPYAGLVGSVFAEYPIESKQLCVEISKNKIELDINGEISVSDQPGLGIEIDLEAVTKYLVDVEIKVAGKTIFYTPQI